MTSRSPAPSGDASSAPHRTHSAIRVASLVVVGIVLAAPALVALRGTSPPRNVVLISLDTLRADHLGTYGYTPPTSPCIDRLAQRSMVFERIFSHATWTLPSHMSLFTSLLPTEHGVASRDVRLRDEQVTLAQVLHGAGYRTAAFTSGSNVSARYGFDRGFETYREEYRRPTDAVSGKGYRLRDVLPDALAWLDAVNHQRFFLFLHSFDVHEPFVAQAHFAEFDTGYDGPLRAIGDPASFEQSDLHRRWARDGMRFNVNDFFGEVVNTHRMVLSARDRQYLVALYDSELRSADHTICALLAHLRRLGLADETVVILTSDHGQDLYDRGTVGHSGPAYDVLSHVPLIVHVPGRRGARSAKLGGHINVAPTILDVLGLPAVAAFEGHSLLPLEAPGDEAVISQARRVTTIRTDTWKLMTGLGGTQLYDLTADPAEVHDVAAREPQTVARLRARLAAMLGDKPAVSRDGNPAAAPISDDERARLRAMGYAQ